MKRMLIGAVASVALLAALPASALARHHHHRRHHSRTHHARVRHLRFGHATDGSGTSPTSASGTAGSIVGFDGTTLTIKLNDTSTVSGKVTPDTEIECTSTPTTTPTSMLHEDGDGGGDHSGSGDDNAGSGDQGDNNDHGDDNGDQGDDDAGQASCTSALTMGTMVQEAELTVSGSGAVWKKVELVG